MPVRSPLRSTRSRALLAAAGSVALAATTLTAAPHAGAAAGAAGGSSAATSGAAAMHVVARGLNNPRQLSFGRNGALYVAEAGRGGAGPCIPGAEGEVCFGRTGSVTRVHGGMQHRVLRRLPSLAGAGGSGALGPADVKVRWGRFAVTVGLGQDPAVRDTELPRAARRLGTLLTGMPGALRIRADLAAFEAARNPDGGHPDSNPTGLSVAWRGHVATDSGGNDLLRVRRDGTVRVLAVFPDRMVPNPFPPPDEMPMQAVPTSVVRGPDGAWYVSQLTGFPFPANRARIYRVVPGERPTIYARGLTNVTDLAWSRGRLYAVQIAGEAGLLAAEGLPMGNVVRVNADGTTTTIADHLPAPYGIAVWGNAGYVTTCAVCAGAGQVVRIPLR